MYKKLTELQNELKAPKNQHNKFGGYNYRSLEDILEALKPLLKKYGLALTISDDIVQISDRFYVRAVATLHDTESDKSVTSTAFAREAFDAKGMSDPQLTGSSSSYARKYCLNAMFLIDDTRDDDSNEAHIEREARAKKSPDARTEPSYVTDKEKQVIMNLLEEKGYSVGEIFPKGIEKMTAEQYTSAIQTIKGFKSRK